MLRYLIILCFFITGLSADAEVLKLGRSVSDPAGELGLMKSIGEYLLQNMAGDRYSSYKLFSDGKADNDAFIELINKENIDIVAESLYSAALYSMKTKLEPLLIISRNDSVYLNSYFVVRTDSDIKDINGLRGRTLALKDKVTTPYFFLPLVELGRHGIRSVQVERNAAVIPEGSAGYFITHDENQVLNSVYLKKADAGAVCSTVWDNNYTALPDFIRESLRVVHKTESVPGFFLMVRRDLPDSVKTGIAEAFLRLNEGVMPPGFVKRSLTGFHRIGFDWRLYFEGIVSEMKGY
jgi:hypothetical protein